MRCSSVQAELQQQAHVQLMCGLVDGEQCPSRVLRRDLCSRTLWTPCTRTRARYAQPHTRATSKEDIWPQGLFRLHGMMTQRKQFENS